MENRKRTRYTAPASGRATQPAGSDTWRLDPSDVARHAELRRRREQVSPLGKAIRYCAIVAALGGAFAVYWNFDTLRQVSVQAPALSALLKGGAQNDSSAPANGATGSAEVQSSSVVGTAAPTSVSTARSAEADATRHPEPPLAVAKAETHDATPTTPPARVPTPKPPESAASASPPADESAPAAESVAPARAAESVAAAPAAGKVAAEPAASEPAAPPSPERISFALPKFTASERDAFAAVIVARNGGNRGRSVFTWWTSDGTAKAGSDYVDLGRVVVNFAAGEQNRTIHIPIVGDEIAEGPESFYVNLAPGDDASAEPQDRVEVVIEDDD